MTSFNVCMNDLGGTAHDVYSSFVVSTNGLGLSAGSSTTVQPLEIDAMWCRVRCVNSSNSVLFVQPFWTKPRLDLNVASTYGPDTAFGYGLGSQGVTWNGSVVTGAMTRQIFDRSIDPLNIVNFVTYWIIQKRGAPRKLLPGEGTTFFVRSPFKGVVSSDTMSSPICTKKMTRSVMLKIWGEESSITTSGTPGATVQSVYSMRFEAEYHTKGRKIAAGFYDKLVFAQTNSSVGTSLSAGVVDTTVVAQTGLPGAPILNN